MTRRSNKEARVLVAEVASAIKTAMVDAILEVRALDVELDDLVDDSVNGLTAEVELLQGQLDTAKVEAEELQSDLDEAQARISELEGELDQVATNRRYIRGQLEAEKLKVQAADADCDQWKASAEHYKFELGNVTAKKETLQARLDNLTKEHRQLQGLWEAKVKACDANLPAGKANRAAMAELQPKYDEIQGQYQKVRADYQAIAFRAEPSAEVEAFKAQIAELKTKLAGALQQLTAQAEAKVVMTGAFQDQLKVNERITTRPAEAAGSWVMTEAAEAIMLLAAKGLNDQQIAARFNVGRPMNQQINGAAVTLIRALVGRLAA